jgi:hypothetical protein
VPRHHDDRDHGLAAAATAPTHAVPKIAPPLDLRTPPADAMKTASGMVYKRLGAATTGA